MPGQTVLHPDSGERTPCYSTYSLQVSPTARRTTTNFLLPRLNSGAEAYLNSNMPSLGSSPCTMPCLIHRMPPDTAKQCCPAQLQLGLRAFHRWQKQISNIPRCLVEPETHALTAQAFAHNIELNAVHTFLSVIIRSTGGATHTCPR